MNTTRLFFLILFLFSLFHSPSYSQQEVYSKVRIHLSSENQIIDLISKGVLIDHYSKSAPNSIDVEISASEIELLTSNNFKYDILVRDVKQFYINSLNSNLNQKSGAPICGLQNFEYGTMGHYHSHDEILANIDSMASKYPNLITAKNYIGTSIEGRGIYAVKISDNPYVDERSFEGTVYFDALHHAREPLSAASLLYYMWWLLENYGTDPEATYLIENRELHFIPIVNPDGYVYNEVTNPSGGGMWRKNRRNSGGGDFGVDLNRNYSSGFGDPTGSSNNPSSGIYHGDSAFSEPESRAVRDYVMAINPSIGFTVHTHGQKFLISPGCFYPKEDYESYSEFSSEFVNNSYFGYGTTFEMLNYSSCGTSRHYMHDNGIYAWVPELGSSFWPPQSEFCSTVQNFHEPTKYISYVSGSYPRLNDISIGGNGFVNANDTLILNLRIKNRGLAFPSDSVSVIVKSLNSNCSAIDSIIYFSSINPRSFASGTVKFLVSSSTSPLDLLNLEIIIKEKDFVSHTVTKEIITGTRTTLFSDDAEAGMSNWTSASWDTTFITMQSGFHSFSDTRYGSYEANDSRIIELNNPVDLVNTTSPYVLFKSKWSLDIDDDVKFQISTNGVNWNDLGNYSQHNFWQQQNIDLSSYAGLLVYFRFILTSDGSVQSDGFYFDDFSIVDFTGPVTSINQLNALTEIRVYPNPTSGNISISNDQRRELQIEIYNLIGKLVHSQTSNNSRTLISLTNEPNGIYFIKCKNNDEIFIEKLTKTN